MHLLKTHISKSLLSLLIILGLLFISGHAQQESAFVNYNRGSISGSYSFVSMEQGSGTATGTVLPEAAMGVAEYDGAGGITGKVTWNMPHPADPFAKRFILVQYPFTGTYSVNKDGFGQGSFTIDMTPMGGALVELSFHLLITKATTNKEALEFIAIGKKLMDNGDIPILVITKREM